MTRTSIPRLRLAIPALVTALAVTGCGAGGRDGSEEADSGSTVGVTDTSIKLGGHFPLTGVAAPGYSEIPDGVKAYFDYVNANGGVHGRELEYIAKDDAYNPANTSTVVSELVDKDQVFGILGGLGTPTHTAVLDTLNEQGVPDIFASSGSLAWGDDPESNPMTFGWQPDYEIEGKVIGKWIKENQPDAKVGVFAQDDDFGQDGEAGLRQQLGDQIVKVAKYTPTNVDVGPQLAALQAADVDIVVGFNVPAFTALSQLVSMKLGFEPQWVYSNVGADPGLVGALLAEFSEGAVEGGGALDGVVTTSYIPTTADGKDDPWIALWNKIWDEHGNGKPLTNFRIYGMSYAYTFIQALQATGEDLTREGLVETLEQEGGSFDGPNLAPFRYSEDSHLGVGGMKVVKILGDGSSYEDLSPIWTTDLDDAEIVEDDSAAQDSPPENGIPTE